MIGHLLVVALPGVHYLFLQAAPVLGAAQSQHAHEPALTVVARGADSPEPIPDNIAYAHFVLSIAEPDSPTPKQAERRDAALRPLGLSKSDLDALLLALRGVRHALESLDEEATRVSSTAGANLERLGDLRLQRSRVLDEARARALAALSADGVSRLADHIRSRVKPAIIIYGDQAR